MSTSRFALCNNFLNMRGIYIITHIATGRQYVGSSKNLSMRLRDYFSISYLNKQATRGTIICPAHMALTPFL